MRNQQLWALPRLVFQVAHHPRDIQSAGPAWKNLRIRRVGPGRATRNGIVGFVESLSNLGFDAYISLGISTARWLPQAPHVTVGRLEALRHLVAPDSREELLLHHYYDDYVLRSVMATELPDIDIFDLPHEAEWRWEPTDENAEATVRITPASEDDAGRIPGPADEAAASADGRVSDGDRRPSFVLKLTVTASRMNKLRRSWEFHKGDADPYPSVPHGHERQGGRTHTWPKLDAYRGYIYDSSGNVLTREPRIAIVKLWNDASFRTFAYEALVHAIHEDPTLPRRLSDERGIHDPLRLPRERT